MTRGRATTHLAPWRVAIAWAAVTYVPIIVVAAGRHGFWQHSLGPVTVILLTILIAGVLARRRWAWLLWVAFDAVIIVSYAWDFTSVLALVMDLASFALLISPPMRAYVRGRPTPGPVPAAEQTPV